MQNQLVINNKEINMTYIDNQWWIAIKPICEALGVDYIRQFKNIKEDIIFSQLLSNQTIVGADFKKREMVCLPEKFIYGWIFSLNSNSEILLQYKLKCYEVLYNYFHGELAKRAKALKTKTLKEIEVEKWQKELEDTEAYKKIIELKKEISYEQKNLKTLDKKYISAQLELWEKELI